jgi:hypothetical protein
MFNKSLRQTKLADLLAAATELGIENEDWAVRAAAELARLNNEPVERHYHTFVLERTRGGQIRRVQDQYRVEEVKPAISQEQIETIEAQFTPGHDVVGTARLLHTIRDQTGASSWKALLNDGWGSEMTTDRWWAGSNLFRCLGLAHCAGEPVNVRPNTLGWFNRVFRPLTAEQRAEMWIEMCTTPRGEIAGHKNQTAFWRKYGIDTDEAETDEA